VFLLITVVLIIVAGAEKRRKGKGGRKARRSGTLWCWRRSRWCSIGPAQPGKGGKKKGGETRRGGWRTDPRDRRTRFFLGHLLTKKKGRRGGKGPRTKRVRPVSRIFSPPPLLFPPRCTPKKEKKKRRGKRKKGKEETSAIASHQQFFTERRARGGGKRVKKRKKEKK